MRTDRVIIVTGATGGIGTSIVERFLANGDTVVATDIGDEPLRALKDAQAPDARLHVAAADMTDEAACARVADLARKAAGRVDVLVNAAGFSPSSCSTP